MNTLQVLDAVLKITLVIFMFGNMLDLGLRLDLPKALQGLRDVRFVTLTLVWGWARSSPPAARSSTSSWSRSSLSWIAAPDSRSCRSSSA